MADSLNTTKNIETNERQVQLASVTKKNITNEKQCTSMKYVGCNRP